MDHQKHIFISYRSVEYEFALKLAADLKNAGVKVWIDRIDLKPGAVWLDALQRALDSSAGLISILTPEYTESQYCINELNRAARLKLPIVPILWRPLAETQWPLAIEGKHYLDFCPCQDDASYQAMRDILIDNLREQFGEGVGPAPDTETRYLNSLIAELVSSRSVMEFVELSAQADQVLSDGLQQRPDPRNTETPGFQAAYSVSHDSQAISPGDDPLRQPDQPLDGIHEAVERYQRFVLVGAPGTGKTTTLQQLVLSAAKARRGHRKSVPLPFLLKLTNWTDEPTPEAFIRTQWAQAGLNGDPIAKLVQGKVVLYLDGLNEMGPDQPRLARLLRQWLNGKTAPARVIITCRESDYKDHLHLQLPAVRAAQLDQTRIEQFVTSRIDDAETAAQLLSKILPGDDQAGDNARHLFQLARNPFLLGVLMLVFMRSPDRSVPLNKGTLLKQLAAQLWHQEMLRQAEKARPFDELEAALAHLAFTMIDQEMPVYVPRSYVGEYLPNPRHIQMAISARFLEEEGDNVRFSHQLMQEYFAALRLGGTNLLPDLLQPPQFDGRGRRIEGKWDPVIIALCGIAPIPDLIVRAVSEVDPYLALECIASGVEVLPRTDRWTVAEVLRSLRGIREDGRLSAGKTLAAMRHKVAVSVLLGCMREGAADVQAEALQALKELDTQDTPGLVAALQETEPERLAHIAEVLRELGEPVMPEMFRLLDSCDESVRLGVVWGLGEMQDKAATPALVQAIQDPNTLVGAQATMALGWIRDQSAVPRLLQALHHERWEIRQAATLALGWIGTNAVMGLQDALHDEDERVSKLAAGALQEIAGEAALPAGWEATGDEQRAFRKAAREAFNTEDGKAVKRLIEMLSDNSVARWFKQRAATVRSAMNPGRAKAAVARLRLRVALPQLPKGKTVKAQAKPTAAKAAPKPEAKAVKAEAKTASKGRNRLEAITGKKHVTPSPTSIDQYKDLTSVDWMVRRNAVRRLGSVDQTMALPKLVNALRDEDNQVRLAAVQVLAMLKSDVAIEALVQALGDQDSLVCDAASAALAGMGKSVAPGLLKALDSKNANMRGAAIEALARINDKETVQPLARLLSDTAQPWLAEQRVCDMAARALLALGTPEAKDAVRKWRTTPIGATFVEKKPARKVDDDSGLIPVIPAPPALAVAASITGTPGRMADLLDTLHNGEWGKREAAAKQLREYSKGLRNNPNPADLDLLRTAAQDEDWVIRWAASEALAWAGDRAAIPLLIERLEDQNWTVRIAAVRALLELNDPVAVPALIDAAQDSNTNVKEAVAEALGGLGDRNAIPRLMQMLNDSERFVRFAATEALGKLGDPSVIPALTDMLNDEDVHIRWAAAEALGNLKSPTAVDALVKHLDDNVGPEWADKLISDVAAEALERIGSPDAKQAVADWRQKRNAQHVASS